jgi:Flp pilus assembly protein TadG
MSHKNAFFLRLMKSQDGAVIAWSLLLIPLMLGVAGLVIDVGYMYLCQRELQISTDAAAMAAAAQLPNPTAASASGLNFGAQPGKLNAYPNLNKPMAVTDTVTTVTPGCVSFTGSLDCAGAITANAVQVKQTTTVPTFFIRALAVFGLNSLKSVNLSAVSTAVMQGSTRPPYNVALVMDTTASMESSDGGSNCTGTKVQCAEQGAQILLSELNPCLPGANCGTATNGNVTNAVDEVSLFTFPAQTPGTQVTKDEMYNTNSSTSCSGRNANPGCPSVVKYPDSTTYGQLTGSSGSYSMPTLSTTNLNTLVSYYQVAPLSSNYRSSDSTSGLNPLSSASSGATANSPSIVNAVGGNSYFGGTGETGMMAVGGQSTFFAGALFAAQAYLAANSRPNAQNVIILLSDGDANGGTMNAQQNQLSSNGTYPSAVDQCQQAIDVASAAKAAGTTIYTVGYGVASGGCGTDARGMNACKALLQIASSGDFFVDTSSVKCSGATTVIMNGQTTGNTLDDIFTAITDNLTHPRLIPNNTTFTPTS